MLTGNDALFRYLCSGTGWYLVVSHAFVLPRFATAASVIFVLKSDHGPSWPSAKDSSVKSLSTTYLDHDTCLDLLVDLGT